MSIRHQALAAAVAEEEARRLRAEADKARKHLDATERTRQFFANMGVSAADVEIDGGGFVIDGLHGTMRGDGEGAQFFWWCQPHEPGMGGTYDSARFSDLAGLGRAIAKIDKAQERGRFHQ